MLFILNVIAVVSQGAQNPLHAMKHVGYPEGIAERPVQPLHPLQQVQRQVAPSSKAGRSPDAVIKAPVSVPQQSTGLPVTSRGHTVQVGVVSKPFNLPQQDTSPPGQVNVRTISSILYLPSF